jgi:hypothetical protein
MQLKITLPAGIKDLPLGKRQEVIYTLEKALGVKKSKDKEHNIWARNDEDLLAEAEDELYQKLIESSLDSRAELIAALGLSNEKIDIKKALDLEYITYEGELIKGKGKSLKATLNDLLNLSKSKRQGFLKYIQGGSAWAKEKLAQLDAILKQKLPITEELAEEYTARAALIAKARQAADTEGLSLVGAFVDRFPKTIEAARHDNIVVTLKQEPSALVVTEDELNRELAKERAKRIAKKEVKLLPLQPQEVETVKNAEVRTAEKITEVADRHRAQIKQIVLQAINGRWTPQKLAQMLFDKFGEQNRDWRRVAITELAMATNDAYLSGCEEGDIVWVPPVEGACQYCKKYLEGKSFTVTHKAELMGHNYDQEMQYVWVGKTNYGHTAATYIPCIPLHPNCRHRYHKLSRFYKVVDGRPVLKDAKELIQEERAKRGLPPDQNLI